MRGTVFNLGRDKIKRLSQIRRCRSRPWESFGNDEWQVFLMRVTEWGAPVAAIFPNSRCTGLLTCAGNPSSANQSWDPMAAACELTRRYLPQFRWKCSPCRNLSPFSRPPVSSCSQLRSKLQGLGGLYEIRGLRQDKSELRPLLLGFRL